jgi:hypothetical protein
MQIQIHKVIVSGSNSDPDADPDPILIWMQIRIHNPASRYAKITFWYRYAFVILFSCRLWCRITDLFHEYGGDPSVQTDRLRRLYARIVEKERAVSIIDIKNLNQVENS